MPSPPVSRHDIPIRRPDFVFSEVPRLWANGNPLPTHLFNAAQLCFPQGERMFIKAVRDVLPRVDDPALRRQARGFAGQEAIHGKEHERYFETMRAQGYEIDGFLERLDRFIRGVNGLPASFRVALTAALEHYTATLGYLALADPTTDTFDPTMRSLIIWHATEEVEHKAVAFDVMQAVGIGYPMRIFAFLVATLVFIGWVAAGTRMLLRQDGYRRGELAPHLERLKRESDPGVVRETRRRVIGYLRPGFHPNQADDLDFALDRLEQAGLAGVA